jgi:peptide/nickel transport system permease protein
MPRAFLKRLASRVLMLAAVVFAVGFVAASMVRYSPGFDSIPEDLDPRISPATLRVLHEQHERANSLPVFYARYLAGAVHGDLGVSQNLRQPVSDLLRRRAPVTLRLMLMGTAGGWVLAGILAWIAVWSRRAVVKTAASSVSGLLLAIPPAVLALAFFFTESPLSLALALALLPRIFGTLRALLEDLYASPALLAARARGISPGGIATRYILGSGAPQLVALMGVTLALAFGAAIPIETLCGVSGVGALALQAAIARDMPLLCGLGLAITVFVTAVQTASL